MSGDTGRGGRVAGVLLAAGAGRRFGGPKALARLEGEPLVTRGARLLRAVGCEPVVVVLGAQAAQVRAAADLGDASVVVNEAWETGMGSSLRAGLTAVAAGDAAACVVALVDQPLVTPAAVRRLIAAWRDGAVAAAATYGGKQRNPVLFDRRVWGDVGASAAGDQGARAWVRAHPALVHPVACDDVAGAEDVDTLHDLQRLEQRSRRSGSS